MQITINTEVLQDEGLSLADFLVLLMGYYDIDYKETLDKLIDKKIVQPNLFNKLSIILSNNAKNHIAKLLLASDYKVTNSTINFTDLAEKLQAIYPSGNKPGTTFYWKGQTKEIELKLKLKTLVAKYNFSFTEEEAIKATTEYVNSFEPLFGIEYLMPSSIFWVFM